jgi:hypothetical protein
MKVSILLKAEDGIHSVVREYCVETKKDSELTTRDTDDITNALTALFIPEQVIPQIISEVFDYDEEEEVKGEEVN